MKPAKSAGSSADFRCCEDANLLVMSVASRRDAADRPVVKVFDLLGVPVSFLVSLTFASWNRIAEWLRRLDGLRRAA